MVVVVPGSGASAGELLALLRSGRASTRADLRQLTGLSRSAVVSRVIALVDAGLVELGEELASTGGRPPGGLTFNTSAGVVASIAIGRSRAQIALFDLGGTQLASREIPHEVGSGPDAVMVPVAGALADELAELPEAGPVFGVGLSLPGTVDPTRGVSVDSKVMVGWNAVPVAPYLATVTDAPVFVGNDADILARSERLGHAATRSDLIVVKASTGLGLGILAGGRIIEGHLGAAGEIGHTKVPAADGRPCRCGDVGCLETIAGGWSLVARLQEEGRDIHHIRDLVALAVDGDPEAKQLLRESGRALGDVLATAINLLNPSAVVLGGDMAGAFDVYAAGVREAVYAHASALATRELQFLSSTYGDRAGLVGCAAMALDQVLSPAAVDRRLRSRAA